jgi:hypothetical protein
MHRDEGPHDFYPEQRSVDLGGLLVVLQKPRDMDGMVVVRVMPARGTQVLIRPEDGRVDMLAIDLGADFAGMQPVFIWEGATDGA